MKARSLLNERFRLSTFYTLIEFNVLSRRQKDLILGLHDEAEVYGAFIPKTPSSQLSIKVAYCEVAFLYLHLTESDKLPHYLTAVYEESFNHAIAQLILDQVLEVEWKGKFVSGFHATEAIFDKSLYCNNHVPDFLGLLSQQAIEYGLQLEHVDMRALASRLYSFNTMPWDSILKRKFTDYTDIRDFAFSALRGTLVSLLNKEWYLVSDPLKDYWLSWSKSGFLQSDPISINSRTFKMYVSPAIKDLPQVMAIVLPILTSSDSFSFKIGNSIEGLLRPDKMVAYFDNKSSLLQVAEELKEHLKGFTVQGVPFTVQADDKGILSWGVDPPGSEVLESIEGGSWRCRVTDQLALGIVQAKAECQDYEHAIDSIRSRLVLAGINPYDWMPLN